MSSITVEISSEMDELLARLDHMSGIDKAGVMNAIAEGLRTSTMQRFGSEESPEGTKWAPSIRATKQGRKTLTKTADLKDSIRAQVDESGAAVGTNLVYAATHQFGDERTIRAKQRNIPARPFLGISKDDEEGIKTILDEVFE